MNKHLGSQLLVALESLKSYSSVGNLKFHQPKVQKSSLSSNKVSMNRENMAHDKKHLVNVSKGGKYYLLDFSKHGWLAGMHEAQENNSLVVYGAWVCVGRPPGLSVWTGGRQWTSLGCCL